MQLRLARWLKHLWFYRYKELAWAWLICLGLSVPIAALGKLMRIGFLEGLGDGMLFFALFCFVWVVAMCIFDAAFRRS